MLLYSLLTLTTKTVFCHRTTMNSPLDRMIFQQFWSPERSCGAAVVDLLVEAPVAPDQSEAMRKPGMTYGMKLI